jgi:hypothetical protein
MGYEQLKRNRYQAGRTAAGSRRVDPLLPLRTLFFFEKYVFVRIVPLGAGFV